MRRYLIPTAALAFLLSSALAAAANLLWVDEPPPEVAIPEQATDLVLRQRLVHAQPEGLDLVPGEQIALELFPGQTLWLVCEEVGEEQLGGRPWRGRGLDDPEIQAHLFIGKKSLSGTVQTPNGLFQIRPYVDDWHIVRELKQQAAFRAQTTDKAPTSVDDLERETYRLTNNERRMNGLYALAWDDLLRNAARGHSIDMATYNYFSHTSLDGRSPGDRISAAGYRWNTYAENIAAGYQSPVAVVDGWMNSPGHRANILSTTVCDLGVGYAYSAASSYGHYWTQNFGRKQGVTSCPSVITDEYRLTVDRSGNGTVVSTPAGINCGNTCSARFTSGQVVYLTATPAAGYSFAGWGGACTGKGTCQVRMDADKSVVATFVTGGQYTAQDYYIKVNAYFWGVLGRGATAEELAYWGEVLRQNNGSVWRPQGAGLQVWLANQVGWGTAPLSRAQAQSRVNGVLNNLFGWSWDLDPRIAEYYVNALVSGSVKERGLVNAVLNDLAIMPKADGTYGQPSGWTGGTTIRDLLLWGQFDRYRLRVEDLP